MGELALERNQFLVAEESARAETGAVDDDGLVQGHQVAWSVEFANDDPASEEKEVANERVQIDGRLNSHRRSTDGVLRRKRVLTRFEHDLSQAQRGREKVAATALAASFVGRSVAVDPRHA